MELIDNWKDYLGEDGNFDFSKTPKQPSGEPFSSEDIGLLLGEGEVFDSDVNQARSCLLFFHTSLGGKSSREMEMKFKLMGEQLSHTSIAKDVKLGKDFFMSLYPIMKMIEKIVQDNGDYWDYFPNLAYLKLKAHGMCKETPKNPEM